MFHYYFITFSHTTNGITDYQIIKIWTRQTESIKIKHFFVEQFADHYKDIQVLCIAEERFIKGEALIK